MSVRTQKPAQQARRRPAETLGNGAIAAPQGDPDVAQLAAAEVEARIADHEVRVALAAYFIAEKRGFEPGHELEDWFAAEAQIAAAEQPSLTKPVQMSKAGSIS
ncbi:MAG TPA: DUF2934 domain-containing protein [Steroidobacteraceae bacterium]|nr:DUF2934 domain-containing protein [Steroidobacteraceae bacterium]